MEGRKNEYVEALQEKGLFNESFIKEISYKNIIEDIEKALDSLLENEVKVDGILFATNTIAIQGLKKLFKSKIQIPEDLKVVCFDKSDFFDFLPIPIPYILQPIQSIARMASGLLLEQLDESPQGTSSYRLPVELIV